MHNTLSCRSLSAKEPLITGLFCGEWPTKIRHPTHLCHSVAVSWLLRISVIFRKRAINYKALLRKLTYKDKASYASSPPFDSTVQRWLRRIFRECILEMGRNTPLHLHTHLHTHTHKHTSKIQLATTGWQRRIECLFFWGCFQQKSLIISGSFAERDSLFKALLRKETCSYASLQPCIFVGNDGTAISSESLSAKEPLIIGLVPSFTTNIHALYICGEWRYGVWGRFQQESPIISGSFAERDLLVCVSAALYICGEWRYGWLLTFFWDMSFWSRAFGQERGLRSFSAKEPYN